MTRSTTSTCTASAVSVTRTAGGRRRHGLARESETRASPHLLRVCCASASGSLPVVSRLLVLQELPTEALQGNPKPRQVTVSDAVCKGLIQYQTFDSKQRHHTAIALVVL
jgi:hypothetical protein